MQWIGDHIEGLLAIVTVIGAGLWWLSRLESKVRTLMEKLQECQAQRDGNLARIDSQRIELNRNVDRIHESLTHIIDRLARVETKLDSLNGGARKK